MNTKWIALCALIGLGGLALALGARDPGDAADAENVVTSYFASGQLQSEIAFEDGRKQGLCRRYFANGQLEAEGRYDAGRMDGEWSFWRADGSVDDARSGSYRAGERLPSGG